jgi:hypothetical protein
LLTALGVGRNWRKTLTKKDKCSIINDFRGVSMPLLDLDTDDGLYEKDDVLYKPEELLDYKGLLPYPYDTDTDAVEMKE